MSNEVSQEVRDEIKKAFTGIIEEADKRGDKETMLTGITLFWDNQDLSDRVIAMVTGWLLCKSHRPVVNRIVTEVKNEFLLEYKK